jgi:hypothetical protein
VDLKVQKAPEFLSAAQDADAHEAAEVSLDEVTRQAKLLIDARREVSRIEEELRLAKEVERDLSGTKIPDLLNATGLLEIRLVTGEKVKVKEDVSVSVPAEKESAFYAWLKERNEEDIVKLNVAFKRMAIEKQKELIEFLTLYDYDFDMKKGVHASTLAKYFRELLGAGDPDKATGVANGRYKRKEDVEQIANVFMFYKTIIE